MSAVKMFPNFEAFIILYGCMFFFFAIAGSLMVYFASTVTNLKIDYSECQLGYKCNITFVAPDSMIDPYLYYGINNFYGSHRVMQESKSWSQLRSSSKTDDEECPEINYVRDLHNVSLSIDNKTLD